MKVECQVIGYVNVFGKRISWAEQNTAFTEAGLDVENAQHSVERALHGSAFQPWEIALFDGYERKISFSGDIAEQDVELLKQVLSARNITAVDLSRAHQSVSLDLTQILKNNFKITTIAVFNPSGKIDAYLKRNQAFARLSPWYINPLQHISALKLFAGMVVGAYFFTFLGMAATTFMATCLITALGSALINARLNKITKLAWTAKEQFNDGAKEACETGKKAAEGIDAWARTFIPSRDNWYATQELAAYRVGRMEGMLENDFGNRPRKD